MAATIVGQVGGTTPGAGQLVLGLKQGLKRHKLNLQIQASALTASNAAVMGCHSGDDEGVALLGALQEASKGPWSRLHRRCPEGGLTQSKGAKAFAGRCAKANATSKFV